MLRYQLISVLHMRSAMNYCRHNVPHSSFVICSLLMPFEVVLLFNFKYLNNASCAPPYMIQITNDQKFYACALENEGGMKG